MSRLTDCGLLIFDCDGVLVDSEALSIKALVGVLSTAGVAATVPMIERCFGMKMADTLARVSEETGQSIPAALIERIWPATKGVYETDLRPTPGIAEFLDATEGVTRCVASSSDPGRIAVSLGLTGLLDRFEGRLFSSTMVRRGKPEPDLFLHAAACMGVDPARCIVIEDSVHGVRAAKAAGMSVFGYAGGSHIAPGHDQALMAAGALSVASDWAGMLERLSA